MSNPIPSLDDLKALERQGPVIGIECSAADARRWRQQAAAEELVSAMDAAWRALETLRKEIGNDPADVFDPAGVVVVRDYLANAQERIRLAQGIVLGVKDGLFSHRKFGSSF